MIVGERLSELREEKGLGQKELGVLLGVSDRSISSYENNHAAPEDDVKIAMAKFFNISLDYLMGLTDEPIPYSRENYLCFPENCPPGLKKEMLNHYELLKLKYKINAK